LKKKRYYILTFTIGIFICCNSSKKITESKTENYISEQITQITEYIANDTIFVYSLKKYFPDLKTAENLVFEPSTTIEFIPFKKIHQDILKKTEFYKEYKELDFLKFEKFIEKQDSLNKFTSYNSIYEKSENRQLSERDRKIKLKFSRKINNLVNIEYIIIDKNVDPRIVYTPRNGFYLVEFNEQNEIINRYFILRTIN